jgi:hypothetical protein
MLVDEGSFSTTLLLKDPKKGVEKEKIEKTEVELVNNEELEEIQKEEILIEDRKGEISLARREGIGIGVVKQDLSQIRRKFGEITPEVKTQIEQLSLEKLDILGEEIFDLATIVDLENWLNQQLN